MPGHHPQGAWISERAKRIQKETKKEYGAKKGKSVAYATAVQQAHATGKSPKGFRTPGGVAEAKEKHDEPEKMKKTALAAFFDEAEKLAKARQVNTASAAAAGSLAAGLLTTPLAISLARQYGPKVAYQLTAAHMLLGGAVGAAGWQFKKHLRPRRKR